MAATLSTSESEAGSPAPQRTNSRLLDLATNVTVLGLLWLLYSAVRGVTAEEYQVALQNGREVLSFQHAIGLPSESLLQQDFLGQVGLLKLANVYYIAAHFPITIGFLLFAWGFHREQFGRIRNTLVAVSAAGMVIHLIFPLAPPRMLPAMFGFIDTGRIVGPNPYDLGVAEAANQIAAMPSLHVGWSLIVAIGVLWMFESKWRYLVLVHPAITTLVVVLTANHYWTDAIIAALLVAMFWVLQSLRLQRVLRWV
jgi:hypothetical protein